MNGQIEFVKKPLELRIYGREVKLSRPTFGQAQEWKKAIKGAAPEEALDSAAEMLKQCGMPEELLSELELEHFQTIQELLLGSKKN